MLPVSYLRLTWVPPGCCISCVPRVARCVDGFGRMMHRNCDTLRRPQRKPSYTAGRVLNSNGLPANAETPFHQSHHPFRPTRLPPFPLRPHVCRFEKAVARSLYQTQTEQNTHTQKPNLDLTWILPGSYLDQAWMLPGSYLESQWLGCGRGDARKNK
jgi:hypothetical protein